jgi:hypothetical protein
MVALLPIRPIFLMRVKDLGAVVETVAMADVRVEKEIWGIVKSEVVMGGKEVEEKGSALGGEVDEVQ